MDSTTRLHVDHGVHSRLARFLGVDRGTVINALAGVSQTDKARMIRQVAIEKYGAYTLTPVEKSEIEYK